MNVSIIIVTYNTKQMTSNCIESIFEKTQNVDFEVILVDNGSTDGSKEFFENDVRIKYLYSKKNLGFGNANNLGYSVASGKYIFLLNSDTLLINNAIFQMFCFMEKADSSVGCCGGLLLNKDGSLQYGYHKHFPSLWFIFQEILVDVCPVIALVNNPYKKDRLLNKNDTYPLDVSYICGADLFIRRNLIEEYGLFDPEFFMYYEETELQHRYQNHGFKSIVIDSPKIIHLGGASFSKKFSLKRLNIGLKSRYIYAKRFFSPLKLIAFRIIHLMLIPLVLLSFSPWKDKKDSLKIIFGR